MAREAEGRPQVVEARTALEALTPAEADTVEAIVDRLVPADANGPGAVDAGVVSFIDRALGGALRFNMPDYQANLPALDALAQSTYGAAFRALTAPQKDALITRMSANTAPGFTPDSRTFFNLVREHTLQGMFGDPYWGGNRRNIGWRLIGFPGISLDVKAQDQRLNVARRVSTYRASTYDYALFGRNGRRSAAGGQGDGH
jgi:gluconate 2-dehydrogenase gamma chain